MDVDEVVSGLIGHGELMLSDVEVDVEANVDVGGCACGGTRFGTWR